MSDKSSTTSGDAHRTSRSFLIHVCAVLGIDAAILWLVCFRIYEKGAYDYGPWYANEYVKWWFTAPLLLFALVLLLSIPARMFQQRQAARIARKQEQWEAAARAHCLPTFQEYPSAFAIIKHSIHDSLAVWLSAGAIELLILVAMFIFRDFFIAPGGALYRGEAILGIVILAVLPSILLLSLWGKVTTRPPEIVHRAQLEAAIAHRVSTRADLRGSLSVQTSDAKTGGLTESIGQGALEQYEEVTLDLDAQESAKEQHAAQKETAKTSGEVLAVSSASKTSSDTKGSGS